MIFILLASEPSDLVVTSTAHSKQAAGATSGYVVYVSMMLLCFELFFF